MCFRIDIYLFMIRHTLKKCSLLANCTCLLRRIEWKSKMKVHLHIFKKKSDNDLKIKDNCWKQGNKWNFNHQCHTTKVKVLSTFDGAQKYAQKSLLKTSFFSKSNTSSNMNPRNHFQGEKDQLRVTAQKQSSSYKKH